MAPSCIDSEESAPITPSRFWFDFLDELPDPNDVTKFFVDGLIVESGLNMICACPGAGKSLLSLDLAHSCTHDRPFLGLFQVPQTNVLIIDQDSMNDKEQNKRLLSFGFEPTGKVVRMNQQGFKFDVRSNVEWLVAECKKSGIGLVIFDSLVRFWGGDEYRPQELSVIRENLSLLTLEGITVVLLHHYSRRGSYRGSSEISAMCDSMLGLAKVSGPTDIFYLTIEKERSHFEGDPFQSIQYVAMASNGATRLVGTKSNQPTDPMTALRIRIMKFCEAGAGKTKSEIRAHCACDTSKTDKAISELLEMRPGLSMVKQGGKKLYITVKELPDAEEIDIDFDDETEDSEFVGSSPVTPSTSLGAS